VLGEYRRRQNESPRQCQHRDTGRMGQTETRRTDRSFWVASAVAESVRFDNGERGLSIRELAAASTRRARSTKDLTAFTGTEGETMDRVRTPEERFLDLPDFDFEPHYAEVKDHRVAAPLRVAYLELVWQGAVHQRDPTRPPVTFLRPGFQNFGAAGPEAPLLGST
jgi:hypothetical protein